MEKKLCLITEEIRYGKEMIMVINPFELQNECISAFWQTVTCQKTHYSGLYPELFHLTLVPATGPNF